MAAGELPDRLAGGRLPAHLPARRGRDRRGLPGRGGGHGRARGAQGARPGASARRALPAPAAHASRASRQASSTPTSCPSSTSARRSAALYLAMRYVEGSDLRALLAAEGPLDAERALRLLEQVASALDEAHEHGLVHRDVKPANILVDGEDHAYLGDFGLAKHASSASSLTREQAFVGTIAYVSPEQIRGDELDGRADVYSLGCVLYECLAGAPPFDRDSELAVVYAHLNERPPRPTDVRAGSPRRLRRRRPHGHGEGAGRPLRELHRTRRHGPQGARRRANQAAAAGCRGGAGRLVAGGAVAAVALLAGGGGGSSPKPVGPRLATGGSGVSLLDPRRERVAGFVSLPERPADLTFDGRSAWALSGERSGSRRLTWPGASRSAASACRSRRAGWPRAPAGCSSPRRAARGWSGSMPRTRKASGSWQVETQGDQTSDPTGIAVGAGSVWVARGPEVVRVDAGSGRVQHRFPLPVTATLLAFADGALWAAAARTASWRRSIPTADRIAARVTLHGWISALAVAGGSVWATVTPDDIAFRLNEDDASVDQTVPAGGGPASLAVAPGRSGPRDPAAARSHASTPAPAPARSSRSPASPISPASTTGCSGRCRTRRRRHSERRRDPSCGCRSRMRACSSIPPTGPSRTPASSCTAAASSS